ncbi:MAG: ABC transporter ATP-binding protein, partial [Clostridia bacterium]|nr:ABC transporter ATP-binding protein [Clostridia bacterium]
MLGRVIKLLFSFYPRLLPLAMCCMILSAMVSACPAIFTQRIINIVNVALKAGQGWDVVAPQVVPLVLILLSLYVLSIIFITIQTQLMAYITQGFLTKMRRKMFDGMQNLPIKYFDTHQHGDIMSHYTNDIDTLRQLVSQSLPSLLQSCTIVLTVLFIMLWSSVWMTLVVLAGVIVMIVVSGKIGGGSAKNFIRLQRNVGRLEGYVQEMMSGQKVVKVFSHEKKVREEFAEINEELFQSSYRANAFANMLGPIIMNIGNILYVIVATVGGVFILSGLPNVSLSGLIPHIIDKAPYGALT